MAKPVNPYVAGNPVGDSPAFVGRADVLREVLRVLRRPQDNAIVLYGQRRIGKTSILQHLAARLPDEGLYRPVYFDLQDKADWPLDRVLGELARTIAHALGQPDPDLGDNLETPFRDEWLPDILDDLPDGCSLVLLFDEFDVLADPQAEQAAAAFFPYLRRLLASDPQRMQFVFVIGRNVYDLDTIALSLFKGTPAQRISLLSREDTASLVRLSQANRSLRWPDSVVNWVWGLTHGHPFLTQQLCSCVWERAYEEEPDRLPTVTPANMDAAVPEALAASGHAMEWLWDGLPAAARVVASALAEAGPDAITEKELEHLLRGSGVSVFVPKLQEAPHLLHEWDILEPPGSGYRFRVELLRRWIADHKPLRSVHYEELSRIEPVAESLYQAALGLYRRGEFEQAVAPLRQAIRLNPNHVWANQLLADILLAQGEVGEARRLLERLYEYHHTAARSRLVQVLLAQAQASESDDERLILYERVLELDPMQPEATAGREPIWQQKLEILYEGAMEEFEQRDWAAAIGSLAEIVELQADYRDVQARLDEAKKQRQENLYQQGLEHFDKEEWSQAIHALRQALQLDEGFQEALAMLRQAEKQQELSDLYDRGLRLQRLAEWEEAYRVFHQILTTVPGYKDVPDRLARTARLRQLAQLRKEADELWAAGRWEGAVDRLSVAAEIVSRYRELDRRARRELYSRLRATRKDLKRQEAAYRRGVGFLETQHWRQAAAEFRRVLDLNPNHQGAAARLVEAQDILSQHELGEGGFEWKRTALKALVTGIIGTIVVGLTGEYLLNLHLVQRTLLVSGAIMIVVAFSMIYDAFFR